MRYCEDCGYCKDDIEYDNYSDNCYYYRKCVLTNKLIKNSEAEHCKDYAGIEEEDEE